MISIRPFRGLRPVPEKVSQVASPPYDVLSSEEAREKARNNPVSFLHINKPEIDCSPGTDVHAPEVYTKGAENLDRFIREGIFIQDSRPCFYIYRLSMGDHEQTGLVAVSSVEDYAHHRIRKHENTRPDKEEDRTRHILSLNAQTGPVILFYRAQDETDRLIASAMSKDPVYDFPDDYHVRHTFYIIDDPSLIEKIRSRFARIDHLYIADGHHRSAAAFRVREIKKGSNPAHTGEEPYNFFLSVIFPHTHLRIMDYSRVVRDLNGLSVQDFLSRAEQNFEIEPVPVCCGCIGCEPASISPQKKHHFSMYLEGQWFILKVREGTYNDSDHTGRLDTAILQDNLLDPVLGITNPRTDSRIGFVGGIRGKKELERLVDNRSYRAAFALYPPAIEDLMAVADQGKIMPPKSTWFEPKPRSGVVVHMLGESVYKGH